MIRAKSFDTRPLGPWIVTRDELDPDCPIETRLNGTVCRRRARRS